MKFGLRDGKEDGEHTGIGFVEISEIFTMQSVLFFQVKPFDGVYFHIQHPKGHVHQLECQCLIVQEKGIVSSTDETSVLFLACHSPFIDYTLHSEPNVIVMQKQQ